MADIHEIGTVTPLNEEAFVVVTGLQAADGEALVGPVARGGCMVAGEMACKATCQLWALQHGTASEGTVELAEAGLIDPDTILAEDPQACPDENLAGAFEKLGVDPTRALMVAVSMNQTANRVGYLDDPGTQADIIPHPRGWSEITGSTPYNAFYAKEGDTLPNGEPVELVGVRIGGNGVVVDDMWAADGHAYGITHLTRTNMPGRGHEAEYNGKQQAYRQHVATDSLHHYGIGPQAVTTHIISAVGLETAQVSYPSRHSVDSLLPGWAEDGLVKNLTNPHWQPGMEVVDPVTGEYHVLQRDYPEQIRRQVYGAAEKLGITDIRDEAVLDPGDTSNGIIHSSADRARIHQNDGDERFVGQTTDRDLYAVVLRQPTQENGI